MKIEKGITLIGLVVTIIILVILVGVTIRLLMGNSIIWQAQKAKNSNDKAQIVERIKFAEMSAMVDGQGKIYYANLVKRLDDEFGQDGYIISPEDENASGWNIIVGEVEYPINGGDQSSSDVNWEDILADATNNPDNYKHSEQGANNGDIGIGTDGLPVNMDYWEFTVATDESGNSYIILSSENDVKDNYYGGPDNKVYKGTFKNGEIQGKVPQYIKPKDVNEFLAVIDMTYTFYDTTELIKAPVIPTTVTNMDYTFYYCESLTTASKIPSSVTSMTKTFYGCNALNGKIEIDANPNSYNYCFSAAATNSDVDLQLTGQSSSLIDLLYTKTTSSNIWAYAKFEKKEITKNIVIYNEENSTENITAIISDVNAEEIEWVISNESIVGITGNGSTRTLKFKNNGTATISLRYQGYETSSCSITVAILGIGDTVNYNELKNGTQTYSVSYTQNGGSSEEDSQTFSTENLTWKVLRINEDGTIKLVSSTPTSSGVYLAFANGYINGINIIKEACSKLYGNGYGAIETRNLNLDDIYEISGQKSGQKNGIKYQFRVNEESNYIIQQRKFDPETNIWGDWSGLPSTGGNMNKFVNPEGTDMISKDNPGISNEYESTNGNSYYLKTYISNSTIESLLANTTKNQCIPNEYISTNDDGLQFGLWSLNYLSSTNRGYLSPDGLYFSSGSGSAPTKSLRPVVILDANLSLIKDSNGVWQIETE